ncbi:MAG: class I SAM-dependent methyltransferase [Pseudomonadota bacterium]
MNWEAFFQVHRDLPREGPGEAADVHWALDMAGTPAGARILDAACGPGADLVTLAEAREQARVLGVEKQAHFVEDARRRVAKYGGRVTVDEGSYMELKGLFDLIWCAGAVYFHGIQDVLRTWGPHLAPGGAVAFSEPALITTPATDAVRAFWEGEGEIKDQAGIETQIRAAGWGIVGQRWVIGAPWAEYYGPMSARLDQLEESEPSPEVAEVIVMTRREIAIWHEVRSEIAYSLFVVRPV